MLTLWLPCDRFDVLVSSQSITTVVSKCGPLMWATLAATTNFTTTMTGGKSHWPWLGHGKSYHNFHTSTSQNFTMSHGQENHGKPTWVPQIDQKHHAGPTRHRSPVLRWTPLPGRSWNLRQMFWLQQGDRLLIHSKILNKFNQNTGDFKQNLGISSQQTLGNLN